jgi:hypothetical protein
VLSERGTWRESEVVGKWRLAENEFEGMILGKVGAWKGAIIPK